MDAKEFTKAVETHVRPATFPVAAKFLEPGEPVPKRRDGRRET